MTDNKGRACRNCQYWDNSTQRGRSPGGYCRIDPPTFIGKVTGVWPNTLAEDWCGRFSSGNDLVKRDLQAAERQEAAITAEKS